MLSGVGPEAHLTEHKIPVVASLPGVGEHLMDHPVVDVALAETTGTSLNFLKPTTIWHHVQHITALLTYYFTGKGPLTSNVTCPCSISSFFRFQQSDLRRSRKRLRSSVPTIQCFLRPTYPLRLQWRTQPLVQTLPIWSSSCHL